MLNEDTKVCDLVLDFEVPHTIYYGVFSFFFIEPQKHAVIVNKDKADGHKKETTGKNKSVDVLRHSWQ